MSGALPSRTRTVMPGCEPWKLASSPGRSIGPGGSIVPSATVPSSRPRSAARSERMASAPATISRARSNTASPASVSSTPRLVRRSSSNPSSASSLPTAVDTADWVRWSSSAARVNDPACVTCTNARNCRSSMAPS